MTEPAKIWCLFSIANDYDQPENNLERWWITKPSLEQLFRTLLIEPSKATDWQIVAATRVWAGEPQTIGEYHYRLVEVEEGKAVVYERKES